MRVNDDGEIVMSKEEGKLLLRPAELGLSDLNTFWHGWNATNNAVESLDRLTSED